MTTTFPDLLAAQLRADGARPLVTFYDDATGERIELSVVTFANWVAKTAGLLQDELDAERGGLLVVDLPTHWQGVVWVAAAWTLGMRVAGPERAAGADVVVCGPDTLEGYGDQDCPVVACSLRPLGGRFTEPLPANVLDYGAVVLGQPDAFFPLDPPVAGDAAWDDGTTQQQLLAEAATDDLGSTGARLLTDVPASTRAGLRTLLAPLMHGGGTVWVRNPAEDGWAHRAETERATATLRAQPAG